MSTRKKGTKKENLYQAYRLLRFLFYDSAENITDVPITHRRRGVQNQMWEGFH